MDDVAASARPPKSGWLRWIAPEVGLTRVGWKQMALRMETDLSPAYLIRSTKTGRGKPEVAPASRRERTQE